MEHLLSRHVSCRLWTPLLLSHKEAHGSILVRVSKVKKGQ